MEVIPTGDLKLTTVPQSVELERDVLGVFLTEKDSFPLHADKLHDGLFFDIRNKIVFKAFFSLFKAGKGIDLITAWDETKKSKNEDVGPVYLSQLQMGVASAAHLDEWIAILNEKYLLRELLKLSQKTYYSALDPQNDVFDILSDLEGTVSGIMNNGIFSKEPTFAESVQDVVKNIRLAADNGGMVGIKTGDDFIDKNLMGLVAPDVTIIAARPKSGKTTLALNLALSLAKQNHHIGFFSYEMRDMQLIWKIISHYIGASVNEIRSGNLQDKWDVLEEKYPEIKNLPFHLCSQFLNVFQMKSKIKSWIVKHDIKAVFIDYLQLIPAIPEYRKQNREAQVSFNSREIKAIAMECNIPIIELSQLSREGAKTEPELHHLRESGALEQDADNVIFLYHNEDTTQQYFPGWVEGNAEWTIDFIIKACRLGSNGRRTRILNAAHNSFRELSEMNLPESYSRIDYRDYTEPNIKQF